MAVQADRHILVGGGFSSLGGSTRNNIGRLDENGALDAGFDPNADGAVFALSLQEDISKVLLGGYFSSLGGTSRNYIGRVSLTDGSVDGSFVQGADDGVVAFAQQGSCASSCTVVVGGQFTNLAGQPRNYIARLNADGTLDTTFTPPFVLSSVRASTNPTIATSVDFTVTFSENVTAVDNADFSTSGIADAAVSGVSGSGDTYTVTVNTGSSSGTLRLDVIVDPANPILDGTSTQVLAYNAGQSYTVDHSLPVVSSIVRANPVGAVTNASSVDYHGHVFRRRDGGGCNVTFVDFELNTSGITGAAVTGCKRFGKQLHG